MCHAEFLSSNPQMQILTCFGHCGADCQVRVATPANKTALLDVELTLPCLMLMRFRVYAFTRLHMVITMVIGVLTWMILGW